MIEWKRVAPLVGPSYYNGFVGKIQCFVISWNPFEGKNYKVASTLPGIKTITVNTVQEGMAVGRELFEGWLKQAGLKFDE